MSLLNQSYSIITLVHINLTYVQILNKVEKCMVWAIRKIALRAVFFADPVQTGKWVFCAE